MDREKTEEQGVEALFGPDDVIVVCTRAQAIADGVLIDVTGPAKEAGFKVPVAITAEVWSRCVALTPAAEQMGNDLEGRLWDVIWMAYVAAHCAPDAREVIYPVLVVTDSPAAEQVELKITCGPGDEGEPVITIMMPEED